MQEKLQEVTPAKSHSIQQSGSGAHSCLQFTFQRSYQTLRHFNYSGYPYKLYVYEYEQPIQGSLFLFQLPNQIPFGGYFLSIVSSIQYKQEDKLMRKDYRGQEFFYYPTSFANKTLQNGDKFDIKFERNKNIKESYYGVQFTVRNFLRIRLANFSEVKLVQIIYKKRPSILPLAIDSIGYYDPDNFPFRYQLLLAIRDDKFLQLRGCIFEALHNIEEISYTFSRRQRWRQVVLVTDILKQTIHKEFISSECYQVLTLNKTDSLPTLSDQYFPNFSFSFKITYWLRLQMKLIGQVSRLYEKKIEMM